MRRPALIVVLVLAAALPAVASGSPGSPSTAIVSLGDSYISGEAGRWQGNSNVQTGSRSGTDRAWVPTWYGGTYDRSRVYQEGTGADGGCHRSDVAEILSNAIAVTRKVNLACSGATTANVLRAASGGVGQNGEAPQADRLAGVARDNDVKLVVVSVGGNDLGFASIITACATAFSTSPSWSPRYCRSEQQAKVDQRMPTAMANVGRALDDIRTVMSGAGYAPSQYRLVLQSYPSPVPRGAENRYSQSGWSRLDTGGCPFWNADSDWARDSLVDQIADNLRTVAGSRGAQFLDLRDQLQGREVCAKGTSLSGSGGPSATGSEWARFLVSGVLQGDVQESFHPNAYGQRAGGRCLELLWSRPTGDWRCTNTPGAAPSAMTLAPA